MERKILRYLVFVAVVALFPGSPLSGTTAFGALKRLSAVELQAMINNGEDVTIIDVRTPEEYNEGHIPGSISVPLGTIKDLESVSYKGKVVLYCTAGVRSYKAVKLFAAKGLEDLMDLKGGINDWEGSGGDLVTDEKKASANEEEEDYFFTGTPPGATVPKGVCEIGIAPNMKLGGEN
jgi:rhodanese-related sulfurtransferase